MSKHLIFLPCSIHGVKSGHLYGIIKTSTKDKDNNIINANSYYVLNINPEPSFTNDIKSKKGYTLIGNCHTFDDSLVLRLSASNPSNEEIEIRLINDKFKICTPFHGKAPTDLSRTVIIVYDDQVFKDSELFVLENGTNLNGNDHFKVLATLIRTKAPKQVTPFTSGFEVVWSFLLFIASLLLSIVSIAKPVFQYSALGSQLHSFLDSLVWSLKSLKSQNKVSLKVGNYIIATAVDICAGIFLLYFIDYIGITAPFSEYVLNNAKDVVQTLHHLLQWLSGSPAGLKLNGPFNSMMGRFFMYNINLWWVFLSVAQPLLEFLFTIFLGLGRLGVTFQAAILSDLLFLVSFHIYCIYVYAARVYYLQLSGLRALWRLFLGRKHNPLRKRVDSCQYSPDQLFVGTLAFTILLFLLPTTLMYYVVFTTMRLILLCLSGVLTQACFLLNALPIFATVHWLFGSNSVRSSVHMIPKCDNSGYPVVLFVTLVADSWWNTVRFCVPDTVICPPFVDFGQLIHKLTVGELVCPVLCERSQAEIKEAL